MPFALLCKYLLFPLQMSALPSFSTSSPQCFSIRLQSKFPLPKFLGNPVDLHSWLDNQRSRSKLLLRIGSDDVFQCTSSSHGAKTSPKAKNGGTISGRLDLGMSFFFQKQIHMCSKAKGILPQKYFYRPNLILWIVMGCDKAHFGWKGQKNT